MATTQQPGDPATEPEMGTQQDPEQSPSGETPQDETQESTTQQEATEPTSPDPAPAKDPAKTALLADLHKERSDRKALQTKVTELESQVADLQPTKDTLDAVQRKYDRLEEFLTKAGGPLGKALDSRSFTTSLFETDESVDDIVAAWNRANPNATSTALGAGSGHTSDKDRTINDLLRAAAR